MAAMTELQKLHQRWHNKTGEDMPTNIALLPLDRIRRAVELTEQGITVVVPPVLTESAVGTYDHSDSSLSDWDGHNNLK